MTNVEISLFDFLEPLTQLTAERKRELADLCVIESVSKGLNPLRMNLMQAEQLIYLVQGEALIQFDDRHQLLLRGGSPAAKHPFNNSAQPMQVIANTELQILRVDADLLAIMDVLDWLQVQACDAHKK